MMRGVRTLTGESETPARDPAVPTPAVLAERYRNTLSRRDATRVHVSRLLHFQSLHGSLAQSLGPSSRFGSPDVFSLTALIFV